ncbi:MAG: hypothetical protein ACRYG7_44580 [Janthinobacterium lividum]
MLISSPTPLGEVAHGGRRGDEVFDVRQAAIVTDSMTSAPTARPLVPLPARTSPAPQAAQPQ